MPCPRSWPSMDWLSVRPTRVSEVAAAGKFPADSAAAWEAQAAETPASLPGAVVAVRASAWRPGRRKVQTDQECFEAAVQPGQTEFPARRTPAAAHCRPFSGRSDARDRAALRE